MEALVEFQSVGRDITDRKWRRTLLGFRRTHPPAHRDVSCRHWNSKKPGSTRM